MPDPAPAAAGPNAFVSPSAPQRTIALVGLMGVGKTSVGRRLAAALGLPFLDADEEVERAAGMSVADIFSLHGEAAFRDGERKVIARLLDGPPAVLATGGGAFMHPDTRALLKRGSTTVWLTAPLEVLVRRVTRKDTRPLLRGRDPAEVLAELAAARFPVYAEAHVTVDTGDGPHAAAVEAVLAAVAAHHAQEDAQ